MLHQLAEDLGTSGYVGESHNGVMAGHIFCQLHSPHNVIRENGHFHHREIQPLPQFGGGAASGDNHVIIVIKIASGQLYSLLQVPHKYRKLNIRVFFGLLLHEKFHAFIGGNPQQSDF